eukprot:3192880-Prymnesium_polylepis.1
MSIEGEKTDPALISALTSDFSLNGISGRLAKLVHAGEYEAALEDPLALQLLGEAAAGDAGVADRVRDHLKEFGGGAAVEWAAGS